MPTIQEISKKEQLRIVFKVLLNQFIEDTHGAFMEWDGCMEDVDKAVELLLKEVSIRTDLR